MFWEQEIETMERGALERLQLTLLQRSLRQAARSPYYRDRLSGGLPTTLADVVRLPFTTKDDLRNNFPYGLLAVGLDEVVRLHSSSGTTGNPTVVFHTSGDIAFWTNLVARCMYMAGVRKGDVFQNTMGYGLFTGGLGFHYGGEKLGALTIPVGPGNSKRQIWFMQQFKTTVVHILPSYALRLLSTFAEMGLDPKKDMHLRIAFIGSEPHSEEMRRQIEQAYGITAFNSYGLSEVCGPGVAFECPEQNGLHIWEDTVYPEIIDPATGAVLPDGEEGELVLTTLQKTAMPIIRYRTHDLTRILPGPCPCGRTHRRIDRIKGRSDDMLIINGVNIFPIQIERTIMKIPQVGTNYVIEISESNFMDKLTVKVEMNEGTFPGTLPELERIQDVIAQELKAELGVSPVVNLVEQGSLPVTEGKAKRVYDLRTTLK
jgi:phenylacetate-CoA ligase